MNYLTFLYQHRPNRRLEAVILSNPQNLDLQECEDEIMLLLGSDELPVAALQLRKGCQTIPCPDCYHLYFGLAQTKPDPITPPAQTITQFIAQLSEIQDISSIKMGIQ